MAACSASLISGNSSTLLLDDQPARSLNGEAKHETYTGVSGLLANQSGWTNSSPSGIGLSTYLARNVSSLSEGQIQLFRLLPKKFISLLEINSLATESSVYDEAVNRSVFGAVGETIC